MTKNIDRDCKRKIAVIIPTYKATKTIINVLEKIPSFVNSIYIIDDCCPERTGEYVNNRRLDKRIKVIRHHENIGVGGAVLSGYSAAIADGMDILVKIDSDGQMDPDLIHKFVIPIINQEADYTKGNRFYDLEEIHNMPRLRLIGNSALSFVNKVSSGYWDVFDPTNGYTAINSSVASHLPFKKISRRFFFESDVLFRLNLIRAVVQDIPMDAKYGDEVSNLKIRKVIPEFIGKHAVNTFKRILYNYYLRDMSAASFELPIGIFLIAFGLSYGGYHWYMSYLSGIPSEVGSIMLSSICSIAGLQLLLAFIAYDVASIPRKVIFSNLESKSKKLSDDE